MRFLWLLLMAALACGPSTAKQTAPLTGKPTQDKNDDETGFEPIAHLLCMPMVALALDSGVREAYSEAMAQFDKAGKMTADNRWKEAAGAYLKAASMLRIKAEIAETNRRTAYANAAISYINAKLPDRARAALSAAANEDPALAADLRRSASEIPETPRCTLGGAAHPR